MQLILGRVPHLSRQPSSLTLGLCATEPNPDPRSSTDPGEREPARSVCQVRELPGLSLSESLAAVMGGRHVLLVLDNCEHVIDAAAGLCDTLLRAGDDLRVLATSREPLGVTGEVRFPLPPLPVPADVTAEGLAGSESVALFVERAGQADPDFTLTSASGPLVATVVQRLTRPDCKHKQTSGSAAGSAALVGV